MNIGSKAAFWAEALNPAAGTTSLASYPSAPFDGLAAITQKNHGEGQVFYCGIYPQFEQAIALVQYLAEAQKIPLLDIPAGLMVLRRGVDLLAMNFTETPLTFTLLGKKIYVAARDFLIMRE